jgi:tetratricopeptide (TPR) repeat protein
VLDLLGLPALAGVQGVSLAPLIDGRERDLALTAYGEATDFVSFGTSPLRYLREGDWKYIHKVGPELYRLDEDPGELENVLDSHPDVVERLRTRLETLIAEAGPPPADATPVFDASTSDAAGASDEAASSLRSQLDQALASLALQGIDPREAHEDLLLMNAALEQKRAATWADCARDFGVLWQKFEHPFFGRHFADCAIGAGDYAAAVQVFEALVAQSPGDPELLTHLADAQIRSGRADEAERHLAEALAADACTPDARALLAQLAFVQRRFAEQLSLLEAGVAACPENADLFNNLAWALATLPDEALRDGARSVELARRTLELDAEPDAGHLDTLAAAHAEAGDFDAAVRVMREAVRLESKRESSAILGALREHLATFEAGRALRDPAS